MFIIVFVIILIVVLILIFVIYFVVVFILIFVVISIVSWSLICVLNGWDITPSIRIVIINRFLSSWLFSYLLRRRNFVSIGWRRLNWLLNCIPCVPCIDNLSNLSWDPNISHVSFVSHLPLFLFECFIITDSRRFKYFPLALYLMHCQILQHNMFLTLGASISPWSTLNYMPVKLSYSNIQLTEFAIFGLCLTIPLMPYNLISLEFFLAILAGLPGVELLIVLFLVVDIYHHCTFSTFLNISSTVWEMAVDFGFREELMTVLATLHHLRRLHLNYE